MYVNRTSEYAGLFHIGTGRTSEQTNLFGIGDDRTREQVNLFRIFSVSKSLGGNLTRICAALTGFLHELFAIYPGFFLIYFVLLCIHKGKFFTMLSVAVSPLEFY